MIRTQISLTEGQMRALRAAARARGTSIAAIVRQAVDVELSEDDWETRKRRALEAIGRYASSGTGDLAENHDAYLFEDGRR